MSLIQSIKSCWHATWNNFFLIKDQDHQRLFLPEWADIELYGTRTEFLASNSPLAADQPGFCIHVNVKADGSKTYQIRMGVLTLSDKLVCSFLAWPFTLLKALLYFLFTALGCALLPVIVSMFVLGLLIFLYSSTVPSSLVSMVVLPVIFVCVSLFKALASLFQLIFRIPVGVGLCIKAVVDWILGKASEPLSLHTIAELNQMTIDQIRVLGIGVTVERNQEEWLGPQSAIGDIEGADNSPEFPVNYYQIPSRYQCCILMDCLQQPVLLGDGRFYSEAAIMQHLYGNGRDAAVNSPNGGQLATKHYCLIPSFTNELTAFQQAIWAESKRPSPNYEPILAIAQRAEQTAEKVRADLLKISREDFPLLFKKEQSAQESAQACKKFFNACCKLCPDNDESVIINKLSHLCAISCWLSAVKIEVISTLEGDAPYDSVESLAGVAPCKHIETSELEYSPWQSLASSQVPSLA